MNTITTRVEKWIKPGLVMLLVLLAGLMFLPLSVMGEGREEPEEVKTERPIRVGGYEFKSRSDYYRSGYFKASGKRCGLYKRYSKEDLRELIRRGGKEGSGEDCSLSRTEIREEYGLTQTYVVPVVVHVLFGSDEEGKITGEQIHRQIKTLNEDYAAIAGSMGGKGNCTRVQFDLVAYSRIMDDDWHNDVDEMAYKTALSWDPQKYLNIYVNTASGYLGYSTLPQMDAGEVVDGVVVSYDAFGGRNEGSAPYDQGRTLTHEVGHYLGLLHTFEDYGCFEGYEQGDLIADTFSESEEHYGCIETNTCQTPDNIHNYMNYTDDLCMEEFTREQANRMICSIINYRPLLYRIEEDEAPFGEFDTPASGSLVQGSIALSGWALDDIGVTRVELYAGETYIGDATLVEGARPDIETAFSSYPYNDRAGWGFLLLTQSLPNEGHGEYILYARATDTSGNTVTIGWKWIRVDNSSNPQPFGMLETPGPGAITWGAEYENWGWVLTPQPNFIPENGSTIQVLVDGKWVGNPVYNFYRGDIAGQFPGYANSAGAVGYYHLDTTAFQDGMHTIQWTVVDSAGNTEGIGSRYFSIINGNNGGYEEYTSAEGVKETSGLTGVLNGFTNDNRPLGYKKRCESNQGGTGVIYRDKNAEFPVYCEALQPIQLLLEVQGDGGSNWDEGYLVVGDGLRPLPVGSTLAREAGVFYWSPGPGFWGDYALIFLNRRQGIFKRVHITIK